MESLFPEFFYVSCNNDLNQESWFDAEYIHIEGIDLHFREYKRNIEVRNVYVITASFTILYQSFELCAVLWRKTAIFRKV